MNKVVIAIVVIVVILAGGFFLYKYPGTTPQSEVADTQTNTTVQDVTPPPVQETTVKSYDVVYTDAGFSPAELTIKAGDTVNFKNQSTGKMWVGSAMHPTHTVYSGTTLQQHCPDTANNAFDECKGDAPGTTWSFTFTKAGSWGYHDHLDSRHFGKIVAE